VFGNDDSPQILEAWMIGGGGFEYKKTHIVTR